MDRERGSGTDKVYVCTAGVPRQDTVSRVGTDRALMPSGSS
jgi:hypothetical protein